MEKVLFVENQKFTQLWLWLLLLISALAVVLPFGYGIYSQEVLHKPFGNNPVSTILLIAIGSLTLLICAGIIILFVKANLNTRITTEYIEVNFRPLLWKKVKIFPSSIEKWEVRNYNPLMDYGGWGVKKSFRNGKVYSTSGNCGLFIQFNDGKKLMIGTQKKQSIGFAMGKLMNKTV